MRKLHHKICILENKYQEEKCKQVGTFETKWSRGVYQLFALYRSSKKCGSVALSGKP